MRTLLALAFLTCLPTRAAELNHFYLVLNHETYHAIEASDFLKSQFATFEKRTTVRTDSTYTAIYFYGDHTYFELFDADQQRKPGDSAIAFGVDTAAAEPKIAIGKGLITREWRGVQWPWFYRWPGPDSPGLLTWLMEYDSGFLAKWHPEAGGPDGITRTAVLQRYKAVLPQTPSEPMLEDIVALTVAASPTQRQVFQQWMVDIAASPLVEFVDSSSTGHGIRQVRFRLRRAPAKTLELRFGEKSVLELRPDRTAIWSF